MGVISRRRRPVPEGLRVLPDGSWLAGEEPLPPGTRLRDLKSRLAFEEDRAFVEDGDEKVSIELLGPPFEVVRLELSAETGRVSAHLDDGSTEELAEEGSVWMNGDTGRFECSARGGRSRAVFSSQAHQALLDAAEQEQGRFFLRAGERRIAIAT